MSHKTYHKMAHNMLHASRRYFEMFYIWAAKLGPKYMLPPQGFDPVVTAHHEVVIAKLDKKQ